MKILITGGAGFIGSHVCRLFVQKYPEHHIFNLDVLTYAGNLDNLRDIEGESNYTFVKGDITDEPFIYDLFQTQKFDSVIPSGRIACRPIDIRPPQFCQNKYSRYDGFAKCFQKTLAK